MFILTEISDLIRIPPHTFHVPLHESLTNEIHKKYSNRVINNLGLAISLWDIQDIKEGLLKPGDGGSFVEIRFRLILWKPFLGEVLEGEVTDCTIEGIKVKLDFFDEIVIPKNYLFENCEFRGTEKAWCWKPDADTELFIDINEKIRFRVEEEVFFNIKPKPQPDTTHLTTPNINSSINLKQKPELENDDKSTPPYVIMASCQTDGMGCVSWWD